MRLGGQRAAILREHGGSLESWHLMAWPPVKQMLQALPALSRAQMRPLVAQEERASSYRAVLELQCVCVCVDLSLKETEYKKT